MCAKTNNIDDDLHEINWCRIFRASKKAMPQYVEHLTNIEDHRLQICETLIDSWVSMYKSLDENIYSKKSLNEMIKYLNWTVDRFQSVQTIYNQGGFLTLGIINNLMVLYNDNINITVGFMNFIKENYTMKDFKDI